jgi:hypothetical protein
LLDPAVDGGVVEVKASLGHHLFQILIAEAQDDLAFKMALLEGAV